MKTKTIIILFFAAVLIFLFSQKLVFAAAGSTCDTGQISGSQTGCTHSDDAGILSGQCQTEFTNAGSCASMPAYLSALANKCSSINPTGIDCNLITQNGYYGREASKMANYTEANPTDSTANSTTNIATNMDCDSNGICFPTETGLPDPSGGVATIVSNILYWILSIFGILAVIAFVVSGIQYILSTGNEKMIDTAKRSMTWSIVGVAIALSGLIIIYAIDKMLRGYNNF